MVTVGEGFREVKDSSAHFVHRLESGLMAAYDWISGPPMSEQARIKRMIAETEPVRRLGGIEY